MKTSRLIGALCGSLLALFTTRADALTIHESATLGETGLLDSGYVLSYNQFLGSRFSIEQTTDITGIGGHMSGWAHEPLSDNNFFGAIVELDSQNALPSLLPADIETQSLAFTTFSLPMTSEDILIPLSVTLDAGFYALVFGAGLSIHAITGAMPYNNTNLPGASYFYSSNFGGFWVDGGFSDVRFLVQGELPPVPLPAAAWLFLSALGGLGFFGWRKRQATA